jgi:RNA polymerase sigma-70 factor (sigma-E family)
MRTTIATNMSRVADPPEVPGARWAALEQLYRAEQPAMLRLASLMVGDRSTAEELVQDAFVRIHDRVLEVERPGAYLRTTVVNLCLGHRRKRQVRDRHRPEGPAVMAAPDLPGDLSPVWAALQQLPERQRDAIVLRFYLDLPDREIADLLGARVGTVASLIHRGLKGLEEVLAR